MCDVLYDMIYVLGTKKVRKGWIKLPCIDEIEDELTSITTSLRQRLALFALSAGFISLSL